jgi:hypothetical protein
VIYVKLKECAQGMSDQVAAVRLGASFLQQLIVSLGAGSSACEIIIDQGKLPPKLSVCTSPEGT